MRIKLLKIGAILQWDPAPDINPVLFRDEIEPRSTGNNQQPVLGDSRQSVPGNWDSLGVVT
jgi:hypothetical protein